MLSVRAELSSGSLVNDNWMSPNQQRGRCRLMLRIPAWRDELRRASTPMFLELCEAYDLTWQAIEVFAREHALLRVQEYCELAECLENEGLLLALRASGHQN